MINEVNKLLKNEEQKRESPCGFHFWALYQKCPWKFYLKYGKGWLPNEKASYFIYGGVFHDTIELAYQGKSLEFCKCYGTEKIKKSRNFYGKREDLFEYDILRFQKAFPQWYNTWLKKDLEKYNLFSLEDGFNLTLTNGYVITIRFDRVFEEKDTGNIIIVDTKTGKGTMNSVYKTMESGGQGITYTMAFVKKYPELTSKLKGVVVDLISTRDLVKGLTIDIERSGPIVYSSDQLLEHEMNVIGILSEISQKMKAYEDGYDPSFLFSRNGDACTFLGCEYENICWKSNRRDDQTIPSGFVNDPRKIEIKERINERQKV